MLPQDLAQISDLNCANSSNHQEREERHEGEVNMHGYEVVQWRAFSETSRQNSRYLHPAKTCRLTEGEIKKAL